jgi:DNA helicase-2/ATP-dependent DNA helicase PcrA
MPEYDGVNILTAHGAKGLEFPVVFLVNLSQGRFPTTDKKETLPIPQELIKEILPEGNYHVLEERRLFYVALTRAKDKLYLSAARRYGDGKRDRKVSPFVIETIGQAEVEKQMTIKQEEKEQLSIFDFKPVDAPPVILSEAKNPDTIKSTIKNFSFSQLESFDLCSLQYKYQYILKIPTSQSSAASFGDSIHRSLQRFYMDYMNDPTVGLDHLLELYKKVWIPIGYASPAHQNKMKKEGEAMLKKYFETFHTEHVSVIGLEKLFKIKVDDDLFITGKIDRIDSTTEGEIEIIDYKTGSMPDEKKLKKSLQLSIYAMAAADPSLLNTPVDKVNLTFYYLQDMKKVSMKRTKEELILVKQQIAESAEKINQHKFVPKVGKWCEFCSFRMICEAW